MVVLACSQLKERRQGFERIDDRQEFEKVAINRVMAQNTSAAAVSSCHVPPPVGRSAL